MKPRVFLKGGLAIASSSALSPGVVLGRYSKTAFKKKMWWMPFRPYMDQELCPGLITKGAQGLRQLGSCNRRQGI